MTAFNSSAFYSGAFLAGADVRAEVSRLVAEALTIPPPLLTTVSRAVAEVMGEHIPGVEVAVSRLVVEALTDLGYTTPVPRVEVSRFAAEVLCYATAFIGKHTTVSRTVAEVLGSAAIRHKGLSLTSPVTVGSSTLLMAATLPTATAGAWGLVNAEGEGYLLTWAAGASTALLTARFGSTISTRSVPTGSKQVFRMTAGGSPVSLSQLGMLRPNDQAGSALVHEVLLYGSDASAQTLDNAEWYLQRRWLEGNIGATPCDVKPPPQFRVFAATTFVGTPGASVVGMPYDTGLSWQLSAFPDPLFIAPDGNGAGGGQFYGNYRVKTVPMTFDPTKPTELTLTLGSRALPAAQTNLEVNIANQLSDAAFVLHLNRFSLPGGREVLAVTRNALSPNVETVLTNGSTGDEYRIRILFTPGQPFTWEVKDFIRATNTEVGSWSGTGPNNALTGVAVMELCATQPMGTNASVWRSVKLQQLLN